MSDRMIVMIRVCVALALVKVVWQMGGVLSSLLVGQVHWDYLNDAATTAGLVCFALLYARERQARRDERASRG